MKPRKLCTSTLAGGEPTIRPGVEKSKVYRTAPSLGVVLFMYDQRGYFDPLDPSNISISE